MSEKKREWTVPEDVRDQFRHQQFAPLTEEDIDRGYMQAGVIQYRIGGTVKVAPIRVEHAPTQWVTIGLSFLWESFAPGVSHSELLSLAGDVPEEVVDEEPVAA
jgi:hypothetical protein